MNQSIRMNSLDVGKMIAMFFIVVIHAQPFMGVDVAGADLGRILNSYTRWAVPFFFIIFGYILGQKTTDIKNNGFLFKYIVRFYSLFLLWNVFYILINLFFDQSSLTFTQHFQKIIQNDYASILIFYYGPYHLWFLSALVFSMVALWVAQKINFVLILLVGSFVTHIIGMFGQAYAGVYELPLQTRDAVFFGVFYLTLGYFLQQKWGGKIPADKAKLFLSLFFVFSVLQIIEYVAARQFLNGPAATDYFMMSLPATIFLFLFLLAKPDLKCSGVMGSMAQNTLGIFLIHPFIIKLYKIAGENLLPESIYKSLIWDVLIVPFVFITSFIFVIGFKITVDLLFKKTT